MIELPCRSKKGFQFRQGKRYSNGMSGKTLLGCWHSARSVGFLKAAKELQPNKAIESDAQKLRVLNLCSA